MCSHKVPIFSKLYSSIEAVNVSQYEGERQVNIESCNLNTSGLLTRYPALKPIEGSIITAIERICACFKLGGKLLVAGNGGSSADAEHFCGELIKGFKSKRPLSPTEVQKFDAIDPVLPHKLQGSLPAISLGVGHSAISAIANDMDPELIFAQQLLGLGQERDIFFGISTSGNSSNIVAALKVAQAKKMFSIALTGSEASRCSELAELTIQAPSQETYLVQELHLPIYHAICIEVEHYLF